MTLHARALTKNPILLSIVCVCVYTMCVVYVHMPMEVHRSVFEHMEATEISGMSHSLDLHLSI